MAEVHMTTMQCRYQDDQGECGGEIEIEWDAPVVVFKTGKMFCYYCERYQDEPDLPIVCAMTNCLEELGDQEYPHQWMEESDEREDLELVSYRTWCWHPLTKELAIEMLKDYWEAAEERAYEARYGGS